MTRARGRTRPFADYWHPQLKKKIVFLSPLVSTRFASSVCLLSVSVFVHRSGSIPGNDDSSVLLSDDFPDGHGVQRAVDALRRADAPNRRSPVHSPVHAAADSDGVGSSAVDDVQEPISAETPKAVRPGPVVGEPGPVHFGGKTRKYLQPFQISAEVISIPGNPF